MGKGGVAVVGRRGDVGVGGSRSGEREAGRSGRRNRRREKRGWMADSETHCLTWALLSFGQSVKLTMTLTNGSGKNKMRAEHGVTKNERETFFRW